MTLRNYIYFHFALCMSIASTKSFADFIPQKIATGAYHTCVLSTDGAVKCWGYNYYNQLGTGDTKPRGNESDTMGVNLPAIDLGLNDTQNVVDICTGNDFTCALTHDGGVKCWGANMAGQLGQGRPFERDLKMGKALPYSDLGENFKVKSLACGDSHACALSDQGLVKCWGDNTSGALGLGDQTPRGRTPEDMGGNLPTIAGLTNIQTISAGHNYSCALSTKGLRCWGKGREGQLGLEDDEAWGTTANTIPGKSPFINLSADPRDKILNVTAGNNATCAVLIQSKTTATPISSDTSFAKCWGYNEKGFLGTGNTNPYGLALKTMGAALPRLNLALDNIVSLSAHALFTCALSNSGRVKCWGDNSRGQLGLGDLQKRGALPSDMGNNLLDVDLGLPAKSISTGPKSSHSCAILINSEIKCWGYNGYGQLGYENTTNVGTMSSQMGEALPFVRFK